MSDNGWPGKPGVPMNPERDGWHWFMCPLKHDVFPRFWRAAGEAHNYKWDGKWLNRRNEWSSKYCTYLGPTLTRAEVEARVKEARRDALEEAARVAEEHEKKAQAKLDELASKFFSENLAVGRASSPSAMVAVSRKIAAAIRALKGEGDE
jgi:hypothetical protein